MTNTKYSELFVRLYKDEVSEKEAYDFLQTILARFTPSNVQNFSEVVKMLHDKHQETLVAFEKYQVDRENGKPASFFPTLSHAMWFMYQIFPTKMVDGVWLAGTDSVSEPNLRRMLQKIYKEELGVEENFVVTKDNIRQIEETNRLNHVYMFKKLILELFPSTPFPVLEKWGSHYLMQHDEIFMPGCVQLALAKCTNLMLPEVIGFTLGYEQLPFHLLLTNYELKELGVDPEYFTVHITVDNLDCGHADQAISAVWAYLDQFPDESEKKVQLGRIINGLRLSDELECCENILARFKLPNMVEDIMQRKAFCSHSMHDKVALEDGENLGDKMKKKVSLIPLMEKNGYFNGEKFSECRFSKIQQPHQVMFGTFTPEENIFIEEWFNSRPKIMPKFSETPKEPAKLHEPSQMGSMEKTECLNIMIIIWKLIIEFFLYVGNSVQNKWKSLNGFMKETVQTELDEKLIQIFKKAAGSHTKIQLTHPETGETASMTEWLRRSPKEFMKVVCQKSCKEATMKSLCGGRMKSAVRNQEDRDYIENWCNKKTD